MLRSLYSGVSGLKSHQTKMDVIGNNVANVNTYAYKANRTAFSDVFSQTISGGSAPTDELGGVNAKQVGLGVQVAAINTNWTPGSAQATENALNVMISGDGFFMVQGPNEDEVFYTRVGNFEFDTEGNLVLSGLGYKVLDMDGETIQREEGLSEITISKQGVISGLDEAQEVQEIATLGVVNFLNPTGLTKAGNSLYQEDIASGAPMEEDDWQAGKNGTGLLQSGYLEMSNVSLADEFTDMIITQRGYQANSRVITVSDTLLEELINLKR